MAGLVYLLCAMTSSGCAALLLRAYFKRAVRLLLWSGLCFAALALNNVMLFIDLVAVPHVNLAQARDLTAFTGAALLLYGLVWDARKDGRAS